MTTTPTSGAADLPEALIYAELPKHAATGLGEEYESFDQNGKPMGKAYQNLVYYTEDQMHAFADATHTLRASHGQAPAQPTAAGCLQHLTTLQEQAGMYADDFTPQAAQQAPAGVTLRSMIEGMSVSVDVSTGDHDAGHRYFGTVTEVMGCQGDKHGVTLLVQDAEPNFTAPTPQSARQRSDLVPGVMHCAKCKFQLNRVTLCVSDGNAYAGDNKTEPCPNGCGPLWPVTWEQEAKNCWKALEEMHERLMAAAAPQPSPTAQAAPAAGAVAGSDDLSGTLRRLDSKELAAWVDRGMALSENLAMYVQADCTLRESQARDMLRAHLFSAQPAPAPAAPTSPAKAADSVQEDAAQRKSHAD